MQSCAIDASQHPSVAHKVSISRRKSIRLIHKNTFSIWFIELVCNGFIGVQKFKTDLSWMPWNLSFSYILFHEKRLQTMLRHHNVRVNSRQRWKQTRFRVCFHLWCELTNTINVTEWQVSWNSRVWNKYKPLSLSSPRLITWFMFGNAQIISGWKVAYYMHISTLYIIVQSSYFKLIIFTYRSMPKFHDMDRKTVTLSLRLTYSAVNTTPEILCV